VTFSDFGTRRRFSRGWQDYVVGVLREELPEQFRGTSNVFLAMKYGLIPMGTSAHEMFMVGAGVAEQTDQGIRESHNQTLRTWWKEYGHGLSIALTDTFGSEFFFHDFTPQQAHEWKGLRHDSGDPLQFGWSAIDFYKTCRVNPADKLIVFSDGLTVEKMGFLEDRLGQNIKVSFGWGTDLTNDFGLKPLSLVVKPVEANGHGLVKLSDNLNKAVGTKEDIEKYKRIFGHNHEDREVCLS
jgi:nicotinate phosphoribosyltransferase